MESLIGSLDLYGISIESLWVLHGSANIISSRISMESPWNLNGVFNRISLESLHNFYGTSMRYSVKGPHGDSIEIDTIHHVSSMESLWDLKEFIVESPFDGISIACLWNPYRTHMGSTYGVSMESLIGSLWNLYRISMVLWNLYGISCERTP